jgi:hypothetical protein
MSFDGHERRLLLATPRIGPIVIERLEAVGIDSIARLRQQGVEQAVILVCTSLGTVAWANRRRALRDALQAVSSDDGAAIHM